MNKFKLFFVILLFFTLFNLIIAFLWSIKTTIKFYNFTPYSEEFTSSLNLTKQEALDLYLETWQRERLFEYDEFTGFKESINQNGNYVTIDRTNGRLVKNNPKKCEKNIFFYGGEKIFGYDVTNDQTIPYFFRELLNKNEKNYCVFNFGRRSYNSTQENILLQKHLLKNKINEKDIIIFLDGSNENGNNQILNTYFINENYNELHQKYWKLGTAGLKYFFSLLPVTQLTEVLIKKFSKNSSDNFDKGISKDKLNEILFVYKKNLNIRKGICSVNNLNCFNFLLFIENNLINNQKNEIFKNENLVNNLTNFGNKEILVNKYSSLSPSSNKFLAKQIFKIIFN